MTLLSRLVRPILASVSGLFLCAAFAAASPNLYDHSDMKEVDLNGLKVWLGKPIQVTAQIGWGMEWVHPNWQPAWSFIHLTPFMARFPGGNLIVTYTMDPDTQENPFFLSAYQLSKDGGATWGRRYATLIQHIPMVFLPGPNDSLMAIASELMRRDEKDTQHLVGPYWLFQHGGREVTMVDDGVSVDWPWPNRLGRPQAKGVHSPQPWENWHVGPVITGTAMKIGNRWIASAYGRKPENEEVTSSMLVSSDDGGKHWKYYSTIADGDPALAGQVRYEGPDETSFIRLADGELMAVFRVGSSRKWPVERAYSKDDGRTWTKPDLLPAWSVEPQVIRTENGAIALSTGRPGLYLWFSADPRATSWQSIDLAEYHNSVVPDPHAHIGVFKGKALPARHRPEYDAWQTTAYTAMVETSPNHLLLVYDRDAERKPQDENDLSRVYVLPIEVERK